MNAFRLGPIRWYHILIALLAFGLIFALVLVVLFDDRRMAVFSEDETDIVA